MVESQRQNVLGEFERLRRLLAEEEQQLLQKLEEEELEVLPRLREGAARLGQQSTQLAALVSELESRCQLPALGLLQVSGLDGVSRKSLRGTSSVHPTSNPTASYPGTQALYLPATGLPRDLQYVPKSQPLANLLPLPLTMTMLPPNEPHRALWREGRGETERQKVLAKASE